MKWIIENQDRIAAEYKDLKPTMDLNGREFNVWAPILSICKVAFPDKFSELLKFAENTVKRGRDGTNENEGRVLMALHYLQQQDKLRSGGSKLKVPSYLVSNTEINSALFKLENERIHHNSIRSALDNLGLVGYHGHGEYYIKREVLNRKIQERVFMDEPYEKGDIGKNIVTMKTEDTAGKSQNNGEINYEDIPMLNRDTVHESEITIAYDILTENNPIELRSFVDQLEIRTHHSTKRCWGVFIYLKEVRYIEFPSEGWIRASHRFKTYISMDLNKK